MSAPRTMTRSTFDKAISDLGFDPCQTTYVWIIPGQIAAEVITDRDDPDAVIPHEGATPRKVVRVRIVKDGDDLTKEGNDE